EILWRAYQASWVYWAIGLFTAFLTSFYMFRLWFMTFFGDYRGAGASAHSHGYWRPGAPEPPPHSGIHESPRVMLIPLVILAVLSIIGGWVGIPGSMGGGNRFEKFLGPVFHASAPAGGHEMPVEQTGPATSHTTELAFTGISVAAGLLGLGLAWLLYYRRPQLPQQIAESLGSFYRTVANKYYIDEIYAILFVKPLVDSSARILWRGVDQNVIDATLDGGADSAREVSDTLRHMQSGNLRSYAGWVAAGAAAVIAYMIWMGVR
ncbi:MAG TPA: NADH-quinone oxidoreductase subunit L, partial [Terriglobales bacterium]